jgi:elongation factor P hydroxylase
LKPDTIEFYDYRLRLLHSTSLNDIRLDVEARHFQTQSFGTTYVPKGSSFGTTSSTQNIDIHPDTLRLMLIVNEKQFVAEFDCRNTFDPLDFVQSFNELIV